MCAAIRKTKEQSLYQLKITLEGIRPPIWRRVLVPERIRLDALHTVIQIAMGWTNSHLHSFSKGGVSWADPDPDDVYGSTDLDERKARLNEILVGTGESLHYIYDFGDDWRHKVALEKILPYSGERAIRPACVGGKRRCPPEDMGGAYGYAELLRADDSTERGAELLEWVGGPFDSEAFSVEGAEDALAAERWPKGAF